MAGANDLIPPERVANWIPGDLFLDSTTSGWAGLTLRGYRYPGQEVEIPTMRDYMIVVYRCGIARMSRTEGGPWESSKVNPGSVSILTRGETSRWQWDAPIEVAEVFVTQESMENVAAEVFDQDIRTLTIPELLCTNDDAVLPYLANMLATELSSVGIGGGLYVETLRTQICVHLLRRYARVEIRDRSSRKGLTVVQRRLICRYIDENIDRALCLNDMAGVLRLGLWDFIRRFSSEFNCPPHAFVLRQRVVHAQRMLTQTNLPIKAVAMNCGFSDQSHMNRVFRRMLGATPSSLRNDNKPSQDGQ